MSKTCRDHSLFQRLLEYRITDSKIINSLGRSEVRCIKLRRLHRCMRLHAEHCESPDERSAVIHSRYEPKRMCSFFIGTGAKIDEVTMTLPSTPRKTYHVDKNRNHLGWMNKHEVLRVTLRVRNSAL